MSERDAMSSDRLLLGKRFTELEKQYADRFAHGVPPHIYMSLRLEDVIAMIKGALASGVPVEGWAEYQGGDVVSFGSETPGMTEEMFVKKVGYRTIFAADELADYQAHQDTSRKPTGRKRMRDTETNEDSGFADPTKPFPWNEGDDEAPEHSPEQIKKRAEFHNRLARRTSTKKQLPAPPKKR